MTKLVNEVYHMYNRHQYPFVALNIAVASGKKITVKLFLKHPADFLSYMRVLWCYFRVCGRERNPGQAADLPSGGETLAGYSEDFSHKHV